ncbi:MAG: hypothetical protein M3133_03660, partial [Actinomycetota bacterium]|nr:hypothetical protein [Actinomycetota bacterium]
VVLGGVGVGKTAVLVELTKRLAEHGALPVPVRLRDAQQELDFSALARRRFTAEVGRTAHSDAEADRAWRELRRDDQIVVLADGLEEALSEADGTARGTDARTGADGSERDNRIRVAMRGAQRDRLPLVVASRPHDALVGLDAAVVELEPLGEEHALEYIQEGASTHDEHRLDWVIETADVTEAPLYLQVARELHRKGLLEHARPGHDDNQLDTRGNDRIGLRLRLLETWTRALTHGYFRPEVPMSQALREATVQQLGVLACVGFIKDTIEVQFADLPAGGGLHDVLRTTIKDLYDSLGFRGRDIDDDVDNGEDGIIQRELRLAATRGVRLGLVEARGGGVRFPHSIMQAYLGSRVIGSVVDVADGHKYNAAGHGYLKVALKHSSRELLTALVMHARTSRDLGGGARSRSRARPPDYYPDLEDVRDQLAKAAEDRGRPHAKVIDLMVAALEIDSVAESPRHEELAACLSSKWPEESEDRTVEEAKLKAVMRFGEVARKVADRAAEQGGDGLRPAYHHLYAMACNDVWYPVRLAAAQEMGRGGDHALAQLGDGQWDANEDKCRFDPAQVRAKLGPCVKREQAKDELRTNTEPDWTREDGHRQLVQRAWLAPLLLTSVSKQHQLDAQRNLDDWLGYVGRDERGGVSAAPISLEIALAQGFKHAANRRPGRSAGVETAHQYLAEKAAEMLERARFWFSRLTLVHALCLWALPDPDMATERPEGDRQPRRRWERDPQRRESDPAALIHHWVSSAAGGREHPFVEEACRLAVLALEKRQPERYIWIDESGVVTKIGSQPARPDAHRKHNLWIPPSTGWSALHPRAQRLVADVLILLNLAERGTDPPEQREKRLKRAMRDDLPACLAGERGYLEVDRTVGMVVVPTPGAKCKDGCAFDLCPYPPKGTSRTYRVELSEAFCRRQQVLLGRWWNPFARRTARWQGAVPRELKQFWMGMEERARR